MPAPVLPPASSTYPLFRVGVAVLLYDVPGNLFLLERACEPCAGTWCPILGRREHGETCVGTAIREAGEEVGIVVPPELMMYAGMTETEDAAIDLDWITFFYIARGWRGEPRNAEPEKHRRAVWAHPSTLPPPLHPALAVWLRALGAAGRRTPL